MCAPQLARLQYPRACPSALPSTPDHTHITAASPKWCPPGTPTLDTQGPAGSRVPDLDHPRRRRHAPRQQRSAAQRSEGREVQQLWLVLVC